MRNLPKMADAERAARLRKEFVQRFGLEPTIACAPGRVNLIGEHTDYNDGFVMPAAIDFYTWVAAAPMNGRFVAESLQFPEKLDVAAKSKRQPAREWSDYCWGVWESLQASGIILPGAAVLADGDVPVGAGLSSSAALEVATAFALCTLAETMPAKSALAKICQRAENEFVGARCGIMDQFISCTGRAEHAVVLDCRSLNFEYAPLPTGVSLVICNSNVKHSIASGEYNARRAECEEGVRLLRKRLPGIRALRDVTPEQIATVGGELPDVIYRRCKHVVEENVRVLAAKEALANGELAMVGKNMHDSHASLRDDYQVSCPELDILVELAESQPGTIGARMTGGGFGGCTINLVRTPEVPSFRKAIATGYERRTKIAPEIYVTVASDGAHRVL